MSKMSKGDSKFSKVMREFKEGTLKSGSGQVVTDRKQAVAIAASEARKASKHNSSTNSDPKKMSDKEISRKLYGK